MRGLSTYDSQQVAVVPDDFPLAFNRVHRIDITRDENRRRHSHL
jgi:hypothetical protein